MSTEPQTELQPVDENKKLLRSAVADEAIAEIALKVADRDATTDEGYEECKKAIRWCVKARSAVTGLKEELNRAALAHQRAVNAEEKRLIGLVSQVEDQLKAKKKAVDDEVERKRKELEAKHEAWIVGRQDHFYAETGNLLPRALAEELSEADYEAMVTTGRQEKQKAALEAARVAQQEAEEKEAFRQAQAKLAAEKAEFERQQAELKAAQEQLARQQAEQAEREREAERKIELQRQQEEREKLKEHEQADQKGKICVLDERFPQEDQWPEVEAVTKARVDEYIASRAEAVLASVQESGDVDEDETVRKMISPIQSEVLTRLLRITVPLARMQNEAEAIEALFDGDQSYLGDFQSMAADIRIAVEALQKEMYKYEPK